MTIARIRAQNETEKNFQEGIGINPPSKRKQQKKESISWKKTSGHIIFDLT